MQGTVRSWWRGLVGRRPAADPADVLDPNDLAELVSAGARIAHECALTAPEVVAATATRAIARGVPLRSIDGRNSDGEIGIIHFADGSTITIADERRGELARLSIQALLGNLRLAAVHRGPDRVTVELVHGGRRALVRAIAAHG